LKTSRHIIRFFIISIFLFLHASSYACVDSETDESIRLSLFRAELPGMAAFRPFYYSAMLFNDFSPDPESQDAKRNCLEWQQFLGRDVKLADIDFILYQTPPEIFEDALQHKSLVLRFSGNTFIAKLCRPEYRETLQYLSFAKETEYLSYSRPGAGGRWESWDDNEVLTGKKVSLSMPRDGSFIPGLSSEFLKLRYAFQLLRLSFYEGDDARTIGLYDKFVERGPEPSIIKAWALLFKAMAVDRKGDHITANYLYSKVFDRSDEKKMAVMQWFSMKPEVLAKSLQLAKNKEEKGVLLATYLINYPAPALSQLKQMRDFLCSSKYFPVLVMREVNKLEDWIYTPMYTQYPPSVVFSEANSRWGNYNEVREKNLNSDMSYLREFRSFLESCLQYLNGDNKDYACLAIAQLYYMDNELDKSMKLLGMLRSNAKPGLLIQRDVCLCLLNLKLAPLKTEKTKQQFLKSISSLEQQSIKSPEHYKSLYTLLRLMSSAYDKSGAKAEAGLLFMKSERYKLLYNVNGLEEDNDWDITDFPYAYLAWFDRHAGLPEIDHLIAMIQSSPKSPFEKYLCHQKLASLYDYYDLRSCIAFRENKLQETLASLEHIPESYYTSKEEFRNNLNEDPFMPKGLSYQYVRNFQYQFSKAKFIRELISLEKDCKEDSKDNPDKLLKLGHAYYNCSWFGNSWMMVSYQSSIYDYQSGISDELFGPNHEQKKSIQSGNYYKLKLAKAFYSKVLESEANAEQKAMANLMLHICDNDTYNLERRGDNFYMEDNILYRVFQPSSNLRDFYLKYYQTETFRQYRCPTMDDFIGFHYEPTVWWESPKERIPLY